MKKPSINRNRHWFSTNIIAYAVWLYCRFNLSLREVEAVFLQRGIDVSYETVLRWVLEFSLSIA